ncbi:hypothetical protein H5410_060190 [Solanum commersonii]|uniref:ARID domain-containing protein n=1 Tax=Solanum commersonii TaxID=4109 RepID=A0A9J5W5A7_SOLCO|nr:hypothetical protein H5410_060190 [Solanum commersonii]
MSDNPQPQPPLQSPSPPQGYPMGPLSYPKPEAEYHEIVQNSQLFWNKLQQFSASLQTNFQRLPRHQWREVRRSSKGDAMTTKGERREARKAKRRRLLIPLVAGTPLDLHRLFVEVTSRGGIEKCCERGLPRRQWQEARQGEPSSPFTFVARRSSKGDTMTTKGERQEARKARKASPFVFS